jgi:hypothetical protein
MPIQPFKDTHDLMLVTCPVCQPTIRPEDVVYGEPLPFTPVPFKVTEVKVELGAQEVHIFLKCKKGDLWYLGFKLVALVIRCMKVS